MNIWEKLSSRSGTSATHSVTRWATRLTLALLSVIVLGLASLPSYAQPSSEPPVVELTVAEADSVLGRIDELEVRVWELTRLAELDSLYYEERLELQEEAYDNIIEAYKQEQPGWLERLIKQPVVWLAIGMWVGVQAN